MRAVGIRVWATRFAFVVLDGASTPPAVLESRHGSIPEDQLGPLRLAWIYREVTDLIARHGVESVAVRITEPTARNADVLRSEGEGVALLAAVHAGVDTQRSFSGNMAKPLGATEKGQFAAYVKTNPFVTRFHGDERDAAMAAQAALLAAS